MLLGGGVRDCTPYFLILRESSNKSSKLKCFIKKLKTKIAETLYKIRKVLKKKNKRRNEIVTGVSIEKKPEKLNSADT